MKADQAVVLVVDDNELNRDMLSRWLERGRWSWFGIYCASGR